MNFLKKCLLQLLLMKDNEFTFEAIFNGKKMRIEVPNLWQAKLKAIEQLKVPKSKQGILSIYSLQSHENGDFRFL